MEKCCRNCHYFEYGRCVNASNLFTVTFEGVVEGDRDEVAFSENDVDINDIELKIKNPESFYCKEWE